MDMTLPLRQEKVYRNWFREHFWMVTRQVATWEIGVVAVRSLRDQEEVLPKGILLGWWCLQELLEIIRGLVFLGTAEETEVRMIQKCI